MKNKGSEIPLFPKKYQIFYCLKSVGVAARFVPCFGTPSVSRRCQILDTGNHSVQQLRLQLLPYSNCLFCLCGQEGPPNGSVGNQKW